MLYDRPWGYAAFHVAIGFVAAWIPWMGVLAVLYQLGQWSLDLRVFAWEGEIRAGNSWQHTGMKLGEMFAGYGIGTALQTYGGYPNVE